MLDNKTGKHNCEIASNSLFIGVTASLIFLLDFISFTFFKLLFLQQCHN